MSTEFLLHTFIWLNTVFCSNTVKCKNCFISNNAVLHKYTVFGLHTCKFKNSQFQTIPFSVITQISSIWPIDRTIRCSYSGARVHLGAMAMKVYFAFLGIGFFNVISRTLIGGGGGGVLSLWRDALRVFYSSNWQRIKSICIISLDAYRNLVT